jgi:hypothetical protein
MKSRWLTPALMAALRKRILSRSGSFIQRIKAAK